MAARCRSSAACSWSPSAWRWSSTCCATCRCGSVSCPLSDRPSTTHRPQRRGLVGPFSGRQLLVVALAIIASALVLAAITTPLGTTGLGPAVVDPRATPYLFASPPAEGLRPGTTAPELEI